MPAEYREDLVDWFDMRMVHDPDVKPGRMMGHPGYACQSNNKLFLMFGGDGIYLKLTPERYTEMLERDDVVPFTPIGDRRAMGTWVVWTRIEPEEYDSDWTIIMESKRYVASEPPNVKRPRRGKS